MNRQGEKIRKEVVLPMDMKQGHNAGQLHENDQQIIAEVETGFT